MKMKQKRHNMKSKHIVGMMAVVTIAAVFAASAFAGENENNQAENNQATLQARARVSKADAEQVALAKVPNGTLKEGELEMEKGKLIWSFAFSTPDSKDITEVNVDAVTGRAVNMEWETPSKGDKKDGDADVENDHDGRDHDGRFCRGRHHHQHQEENDHDGGDND